MMEPSDGLSREFLAGVRAQLPILIGVVPFGVIFGALARSAGIPPLEAQGFSVLVFAGSAQFIAAGLVAEAAPPLVVVLTILVVNLRHMLYSATMAPHFQSLPLRWKVPLAWLLTDEAFAVGSLRYRRTDVRLAHWFFLGTGLALWGSWQLSTAAGIALGGLIPASWMLDFALPLTFMALLVPTLDSRPANAAALTAAVLSVALAGLPYRLGLLLAALLGVAAGAWFDRRSAGGLRSEV
jgi:4-azaleucine resistance transporter AzlC